MVPLNRISHQTSSFLKTENKENEGFKNKKSTKLEGLTQLIETPFVQSKKPSNLPHKYSVEPTGNTTNGSYYLYNLKENVKKIKGVYKPRLQAQGAIDDLNGQTHGLRKGIPVGTEAFRERLAYVLNEELNQILPSSNIQIPNFGVPPTDIQAISHEMFGENHKTGSFQKFKKDRISLSDMNDDAIANIPKDEFVKTAIFDCISLNTDRHMGNLLYSKKKNTLSLIDHGACFPGLKSTKELSFDWIHAPFSIDPFPKEWRDFILNIDTKKIVNRIIHETEIHQKLFPHENMEISFEALFATTYAIESLKNFVKNHPNSAIYDYALFLIQQSHPYAIIKNPDTQKKEILELSIDHMSNPKKAEIEEKIYANHGFNNVEIKRINVGGQFAKRLSTSFQFHKTNVLKKNTSIKSIKNILDKLLDAIRTEFEQNPFQNYNDLLLKSLNG